MKKNYQINIPVSREEKKKIEFKAERCGLSVSAFIRFLALRSQIKDIRKDL